MSMPGILQQLAKNNPMTQQIKRIMNMVNGAQDPQAAMNQMIMGNPHLKQVMDLISQAGGDPKKAFYALAQQKGVDPNDVIDLIR